MDTLLGERTYARVNFEEFKEGFVAVLSRSLDSAHSEDDSSYLEPVVPDEVKPKFVKERSVRPSLPSRQSAGHADSEDSPTVRTKATDLSPPGVRRAKLRRSTSLESVEVLDGLRGRHGDYVQVLDGLRGRHGDYVQFLDCLRGRHGDYVQVLDSLRGRHVDHVQVLDSLRGRHGDYVQVLDSLRGRHGDYVQVLDSLRGRHGDYGLSRSRWSWGVGGGGEGVLCDHLSLQQEVDEQDRASIKELQKVLCGSAPISCSTPVDQLTCRGRRTGSVISPIMWEGLSQVQQEDRLWAVNVGKEKHYVQRLHLLHSGELITHTACPASSLLESLENLENLEPGEPGELESLSFTQLTAQTRAGLSRTGTDVGSGLWTDVDSGLWTDVGSGLWTAWALVLD
ncbi:hypothetical protein D9C73_028452 [Collichthys lucidus]|uniref:Uncharacterized protein n=1 Tax=Collichthys lucidus TaxID=240159 RepID=A0A4U5TY90_COLLU|nr:hypothetical protein D9C73_028452 [Collichthys lucidus]